MSAGNVEEQVATELPRWEASAIELRRHLHRNPELRFEEHSTSALAAERLRRAGFSVTSGIAGTGVVASYRAAAAGSHIAVRADMDALPIADLKDVPYRSSKAKVCHACGHDAHVAIAVTVAEEIAADPPPAGTVSMVFQPAEEIPFGEPSGARAMLDAGALSDQAPDAILAFHCWPTLPAGTVGIDKATAMAAKSSFRVVISGRAAHAAMPQAGCDALLVAASIVSQLHQLIGRRVSPASSAILNIGTISGGDSQSVVPATVEFTGTVRTVDADVEEVLLNSISLIIKHTSRAHGAEFEIEWGEPTPAVRNAPQLVDRARAVLSELGTGEIVDLAESPMASDDFAYFAEKIPGLYMKLGVASASGGIPLHSSLFDIDESAVGHGVRAMSALVRNLLARPLASP